MLHSAITTGGVRKFTFGADKWRENPRSMSCIFRTKDRTPRFIEVVHFCGRRVASVTTEKPILRKLIVRLAPVDS